jgi:hypothetical protein
VRTSRSAWLLVKGTDRSRANSSTWSSRSRRRSSRLRVLDWRRPGARRARQQRVDTSRAADRRSREESFVQPVLDHDGSDGRDLVDLAAHHADRRGTGQVAAAATARVRNIVDDLVQVAGLEQRRPASAGLLARAPSAAPPPRTAWAAPRAHLPRAAATNSGSFGPAGASAPRLHPAAAQSPRLRLDQRQEFLARWLLRPGHRT